MPCGRDDFLFPVAGTMCVCFLRFALLCNLGHPPLGLCVRVKSGRGGIEDKGGHERVNEAADRSGGSSYIRVSTGYSLNS